MLEEIINKIVDFILKLFKIKNKKDVKEICNSANIKLITFYTKYPNEKEYVLNRIISEIKKE